MTPGTYCVPRNRQEWEAILRLADSLGLLWKPFGSTFEGHGAIAFVDNMSFVKPVPTTECRGESLYSPEFMSVMYSERDMREGRIKREAASKKFNVPRLTVEARLENLEGAFGLHLQEHRNSKRTISVSDPEDTGEKRFGSTTITFPPEVKITGGYPTGKYMVAIDPKASPTNIPFEIALAYMKAGRKIARLRNDGNYTTSLDSVRILYHADYMATDWMVLPE